MNRAERRRQEREQRKNTPKTDGNGPYANCHTEQATAFMLHGTPPHRCPRCGEVPQFGGFSASPSLAPSTDAFGMPERASRQWIVENSDKDEGLGVVPIPMEKRDGLVTHARYYPVCEHLDEDGELEDIEHCSEDESAMWELESFEG